MLWDQRHEAPSLGGAGQAGYDTRELGRIQHAHGQDRAKLDDDLEDPAWGTLEAQKIDGQDQMAGRGNRDELGQPFDQTEKGSFESLRVGLSAMRGSFLLLESDIINTDNPLPAMPTRDMTSLYTMINRMKFDVQTIVPMHGKPMPWADFAKMFTAARQTASASATCSCLWTKPCPAQDSGPTAR